MKKLSIKEAAQLMQTSEQAVRMMIQLGRIAGATCYGSKKHRTYYITDEQIFNMTQGYKGEQGDEETQEIGRKSKVSA